MGRQANLEIFIKADDPYSYILLQALASIKNRFSVNLTFYVIKDIDLHMFPCLNMWHEYANYDAYHLAKLYNLKFPCLADLPKLTSTDIENIAYALAAIEQENSFLNDATQLLYDFWHNTKRPKPNDRNRDRLAKKLIRNQKLLKKRLLLRRNDQFWRRLVLGHRSGGSYRKTVALSKLSLQ